MKSILFTLIACISFSLFSQVEISSEKIIDFKTIERNKKNVSFFQENNHLTPSFIISANNGKSKEFRRCKWETKLDFDLMNSFIQKLELIDINKEKSIQYNNFLINVKRNKVRIQFVNSRCTQQHKTHYFQESCSKQFSFRLSLDQKNELVSKLTNILNNQEYVIINSDD